jgi:hypothetical protein
MKQQQCPICSLDVPVSERYPDYICNSCVAKAKSGDGRPVEFFNEALSGGFQAVYSDTMERYEGHICYINNVKCCVDEAHFGGIVVQPAE